MLVRFVSCKHGPPRLPSLQSFWSNFIRHNSSYSKKNYYVVLGVQPSSDPKVIKDNFYKLSKECHPDLNKDDPAALNKFKEIVEAYEVLSSPEEKKKYDEYNGFNTSPKSGFSRGKVTRRFHRGGLNEKGQFVDDMGPPVMRDIQYDLSPEKMEKVWERYKERWNRIDEIERIKELKKKKVEFRKSVDERRANMKNMSPEEKEDFLFKLRMLRTDANVKGDGSSFGEQTEESTSKSNQKDSSQTSDSNQKEEEKFEEQTRSRSEWFNREKEKVNKNLDWRQQLREDIKKKLEEEGDKIHNVRDHINRFYRDQRRNYQVDEEDLEKRQKEEMKKYQKTTWDFGEHDEFKKWSSKSSEDPLFRGMNTENPANFNDWVTKGYERTRDTFEEMKTAQPFTYHQRSVKHGVVSDGEVRFNRKILLSSIILVILMFTLEFTSDDNFDSPELPRDKNK